MAFSAKCSAIQVCAPCLPRMRMNMCITSVAVKLRAQRSHVTAMTFVERKFNASYALPSVKSIITVRRNFRRHTEKNLQVPNVFVIDLLNLMNHETS